MADSADLTSAAANGDEKLVKLLVEKGAEINGYSAEGFRPLCIAAFWGYSNIVQFLLKQGDVQYMRHSTTTTACKFCEDETPDFEKFVLRADVNVQNRGTQWTALHCAAFQGHGKVVMRLMNYNPDLTLKGNHGRTAVDFASALDTIWPFFAAAGCKRTPKEQLIKMDIVKKITSVEEQVPQTEKAYFSRPGSAYVMKSQSLHAGRRQAEQQMPLDSTHGDILMASDPLNSDNRTRAAPSFSVWRS